MADGQYLRLTWRDAYGDERVTVGVGRRRPDGTVHVRAEECATGGNGKVLAVVVDPSDVIRVEQLAGDVGWVEADLCVILPAPWAPTAP